MDNFESSRLKESKILEYDHRSFYYAGFITEDKNFGKLVEKIKIFYCTYRSKHSLIDLNKEMVDDIFSEMDYYYIILFKVFNQLRRMQVNNTIVDTHEIAKQASNLITSESQNLTNHLEKECLEIRKVMIDEVLKKYQNKNV